MAQLEEQKYLFLNRKGITTIGFLQIISYYIGMIFAVIIITNKMVDEPPLYKIYYAFWGLVFYPLVLVWGLFYPPRWRALLIPLYPTSEQLWFLRYIPVFTYNEDKNPTLTPDTSSYALRVFTFIILMFWSILQFFPDNKTT